MDSLHLPGVAASIVKDGEIIWTGAYGWAIIQDSIPATDTTIWNLGSISKTVTAVAAMKAWEEDLFDLDENINDLLPFDVVHYYYPNDTITPRNILVHNSCVEDRWNLVVDSLEVFGGDSPIPLDTCMYNYFNPSGYWYHPYNFLPYPPGSHWEYSNVGASLVGYLTEVVTGDSFPLYCQQNIFDPLGMTKTSWMYSNLNMSNIAMPYQWANGQYYSLGYPSTCIYPAGTLKSSVLNLSRFLMMFMQYGELDSARILDSTTVALMRTIQDTITYFPNAYIGMTWWYFLSALSGRWIWGHTGGWHGTSATMMFCPNENSGAIILTNREVDTFNDMGPMVKELLDWALQYGIAEYKTTAPTVIDLQVNPNPFSKLTSVNFSIEQSAESALGGIEIDIYDAAGRLVKNLYDAIPHAPCAMQICWDGTDQNGRQLGSGVYFITLHAGEFSGTKKVLIVR
jgi:CubicO group peptidase (beta-lactamase class C family)